MCSDRTASTFQRGQQAAQTQRNTEDTVKAVARVFDSDVERYQKMLPDHVNLADFRNAFLTSIQRNPRLLEADRASFWLALQQAAADGLKCDSREAALVIFSDTEEEDEDGNKIVKAASSKGKLKQVVYMPMIQGLRKLVRNTGLVKTIETELIYRGEVVEIWRQNGERHFRHVVNTGGDANRIDDNIIGAYAIVVFKDGTWQAEWMSRIEIEKVRRVSRAKSGAAPWQAWYSEMARKTPLRRLIKQLDKSPEIANLDKALEKDPTLGETIDGEAVDISNALSGPGEQTEAPAQQGQQTQAKTRATTTKGKAASAATSTPPEPPATQDEETWRQEVQQGQQSPPANDQQQPPAATTNGATPPAGQAADTPPPQPLNVPPQSGFEAWLVDENSNEVAQEPFTDPMQFANALTTLCARKTRLEVEDILSVNEGAIADCCDASPVAEKIINAIREPAPPANEPPVIEGTVAQDDEPPFETTAKPAAAPPPAKVWDVLEVPKLAKGASNWPGYISLAKAELDKFTNAEDATAWLEAQKPTFIPKSIQAETGIFRHYNALLEKLAKAAQATDVDRQRADGYIAEVNAQTDGPTLTKMAGRPDITADLKVWEADRPELFAAVRGAATSRLKFLADQP